METDKLENRTEQEKDFELRLKLAKFTMKYGRVDRIKVEQSCITIEYEDTTFVSMLLTVRNYRYFHDIVEKWCSDLIVS